MGLPIYLAMTSAEIAASPAAKPIAYMACHFSPYSTGLSNLPKQLPEDSILILNDRTPIGGHDPRRIARQLCQTVEQLRCKAVLLDFQRPDQPETAALCAFLAHALPCPVAVSDLYATAVQSPVFLPPVPPNTRLSEHVQPWQGRELWLELCKESMEITVTADGARIAPVPYSPLPEDAFLDGVLHCRYTTQITPGEARFLLSRTPTELPALLEEARALGITHALGLYQQLGECFQDIV